MTALLHERKNQFFGVNLHALTQAETVDTILQRIKNKNPLTHACANVAEIVWAKKNKQLRDAINACDLISADGMGVVWGARFLGIPIPERVAATDLMFLLLNKAEKKQLKVYFLGASEVVIKKAVDALKQRYPHLLIVGFYHGYFQDHASSMVAEKIKASAPDMVFVAMPSPKKECFINRYQNELSIPFMMGVGGALDIVAGKTTRAPQWMQKMGMEWLYRLYQEPKRMWRRYLVTNIVYVGMLLKAKFL